MTVSKIRIKMGQIEVEYEGSEEFLKKELNEILEAVSELYQKSAELGLPAVTLAKTATNASTNSTTAIQATTGTYAAKLGVKPGSGKGLVIAAAAHLTFAADSPTFSRQDLLDAAKTATSYYKLGISRNLTHTLNGLVKDGDLIENSRDVFALSAEKREELELLFS